MFYLLRYCKIKESFIHHNMQEIKVYSLKQLAIWLGKILKILKVCIVQWIKHSKITITKEDLAQKKKIKSVILPESKALQLIRLEKFLSLVQLADHQLKRNIHTIMAQLCLKTIFSSTKSSSHLFTKRKLQMVYQLPNSTHRAKIRKPENSRLISLHKDHLYKLLRFLIFQLPRSNLFHQYKPV